MRLFDWLFSKKVTLHGIDGQGKEFERTVPLKQLDQWEAEGKISKVEAVLVHVLDPKGVLKS